MATQGLLLSSLAPPESLAEKAPRRHQGPQQLEQTDDQENVRPMDEEPVSKKLKVVSFESFSTRPVLSDITELIVDQEPQSGSRQEQCHQKENENDAMQQVSTVNWFSMPRNTNGRYGHSPSLRFSMRVSKKNGPSKPRSIFKVTKLPSANHNISGCALSRRVLAKQITELFTLSDLQVQVREEEYPDDALELAENGLFMEFSVQKFLEGHGSEKSPVKKWMGVSQFAKVSFGQDLSLLLGDLKSSLKAKVQATKALKESIEKSLALENKEDAKESENRFTDELGWIDEFSDRLPGELAQESEKRWAGNEAMQKMYSEKAYLEQGLYCSPPSESTERIPFKFALPLQDGEVLLKSGLDFSLPWDFKKYKRPKELKNKPTPFSKISANIFVDRKPRKTKGLSTICECKINEETGTGCEDGYLNRSIFLECDREQCPLGDHCSNQRIQRRGYVKNIKVVETAGRGFGLMTPTAIAKDQYVLEYCGEVLSRETCAARMSNEYKDMHHYYFLNYSQGEVVDACQKGTKARFINHSCDPNCRIEKWTVGQEGEYRIAVFANRDIAAGEELTYDYKFESFGAAQPCLCGAETCRGIIGVTKDELKVKAALEAKKKSRELILGSFQLKSKTRDQLETEHKNILKHRWVLSRLARLFLSRTWISTYEVYWKKSMENLSGGGPMGKRTNSRWDMSQISAGFKAPVSRAVWERRARDIDQIVAELSSSE